MKANAGKSFVVLLIKTFFQWQIILSNVWWIIMNVGFVNIYVLLGQQSGGRLWFIARRTISICKAAIQIVNMLKWNICKHFAHYICSTSGWQQPGGMREASSVLIFADVSGCYLRPAVQHQLSVTVMIYKQNILSAAESLFHIKCSSQLGAATLAPRHGEVNLCWASSDDLCVRPSHQPGPAGPSPAHNITNKI